MNGGTQQISGLQCSPFDKLRANGLNQKTKALADIVVAFDKLRANGLNQRLLGMF